MAEQTIVVLGGGGWRLRGAGPGRLLRPPAPDQAALSQPHLALGQGGVRALLAMALVLSNEDGRPTGLPNTASARRRYSR